MSGARNVRPNVRHVPAWSRVLRVSSIVSVTVCALLLAGSLATLTVLPGVDAWSLRMWMLQAGLPLLAAAMATSALALRRLAKTLDRETLRLRERLYFVATVGVMVLLPAAVLGLRWAWGPRPGNELAVRVVEALAMLIVALLLLRNASDARSVGAEAAERDGAAEPADQPDDLPERSMSSIR